MSLFKKSQLQYYGDLSWFGKILYRLRLKKALAFRLEDFRAMCESQKILENIEVDRKWELD